MTSIGAFKYSGQPWRREKATKTAVTAKEVEREKAYLRRAKGKVKTEAGYIKEGKRVRGRGMMG